GRSVSCYLSFLLYWDSYSAGDLSRRWATGRRRRSGILAGFAAGIWRIRRRPRWVWWWRVRRVWRWGRRRGVWGVWRWKHEWWGKQNHRAPLLMSAEEMRRSADVFSIEFLDMRRNYRVLWGEDVLKTLEIPMRLHRAQVEYELREKTILLRQRLLLVSGNAEAKWELLLRSLPAFGTLFRHALIALDDAGAGSG